MNFTFTEVDIAGNADLEAKYGFDIPVLTLGEQLLLKGVVNPKRLGLLKIVLLREYAES